MFSVPSSPLPVPSFPGDRFRISDKGRSWQWGAKGSASCTFSSSLKILSGLVCDRRARGGGALTAHTDFRPWDLKLKPVIKVENNPAFIVRKQLKIDALCGLVKSTQTGKASRPHAVTGNLRCPASGLHISPE